MRWPQWPGTCVQLGQVSSSKIEEVLGPATVSVQRKQSSDKTRIGRFPAAKGCSERSCS